MAAIGFILMIILMVVLMKSRVSPPAAFIGLPILAALCAGFGFAEIGLFDPIIIPGVVVLVAPAFVNGFPVLLNGKRHGLTPELASGEAADAREKKVTDNWWYWFNLAMILVMLVFLFLDTPLPLCSIFMIAYAIAHDPVLRGHSHPYRATLLGVVPF